MAEPKKYKLVKGIIVYYFNGKYKSQETQFQVNDKGELV